MPSKIEKRLRELAPIPGAPGYEKRVIERLKKNLTELADSQKQDPMGNLYAWKEGQREGPVLMVAAHIDQIGGLVKYIREDGYLKIEKQGGLIDSQLPGRKVQVGEHFGVIGCRSGHFQAPEEKRKSPPLKELYLDVGASSREEVKGMGIEIGTPFTLISPVETFTNEKLICGGALDNRLGCAVLLEAMAQLDSFAGRLVATFTLQEEIGLRGAAAASIQVKPDLLLALDTIPAGDTPDFSPDENNVELGKGPVVPVLTGKGYQGLTSDPELTGGLHKAAERRGLSCQRTVYTKGNNDAAAVTLTGQAIPAASLCVPRRYSHSPVEVAHLGDAEAAVEILVDLIEHLE